jgi:hypothetical protein
MMIPYPVHWVPCCHPVEYSTSIPFTRTLPGWVATTFITMFSKWPRPVGMSTFDAGISFEQYWETSPRTDPSAISPGPDDWVLAQMKKLIRALAVL